MNSDMLRIALDWLPFLIFIGLLFYFLRRPLPQQKAQREYLVDHLAGQQVTNEKLERIAVALEKLAAK